MAPLVPTFSLLLFLFSIFPSCLIGPCLQSVFFPTMNGQICNSNTVSSARVSHFKDKRWLGDRNMELNSPEDFLHVNEHTECLVEPLLRQIHRLHRFRCGSHPLPFIHYHQCCVLNLFGGRKGDTGCSLKNVFLSSSPPKQPSCSLSSEPEPLHHLNSQH